MLANAWFPLCVSLPTCSVWGAVHLTITASPRTKLDLKFTPIVMCHTNTKQARGKKSLLLPIQQILQFIPPVYFKYNANPYLNKIGFFGIVRYQFPFNTYRTRQDKCSKHSKSRLAFLAVATDIMHNTHKKVGVCACPTREIFDTF